MRVPRHKLRLDWVQAIEDRFQVSPKDRLSLSLHTIVQQFRTHIADSYRMHLDGDVTDLAQKIKILSEEKLNYYRSSRFGFLVEWFSCLRNWWVAGSFKSSAELGLQSSENYLIQFQQNQILKREEEQMAKEDAFVQEDWPPEMEGRVLGGASEYDRAQEGGISTGEQAQEINDREIKREESEIDELEDEIYYDATSEEFDEWMRLEEQQVQEINDREIKREASEAEGEIDVEEEIYYEATSEEFDEWVRLKEQQAQVMKKENEIEENQVEANKEESSAAKSLPSAPAETKLKAPALQPVVQSPRNEMMATFHSIWQHASEKEKDVIAEIWQTITKEVKIVAWKQKGQSNSYELESAEELLGSHPEVPLGQLVVKQKMTITFSEEKSSGSNQYVKILSFPDKGLCYRVGMGWLSKDTPVKRILVQQDLGENLMCTVEALGQSFELSTEEALVFWKKAQWNK